MSLSVHINQHLFPQVKFLSKETTIRYPRLVEGCIAHMIPFAKEHDVLSYHSATERFLREQIANRRSYTKKQVRTKFIGKQKATGTSFGGTTANVCCDNKANVQTNYCFLLRLWQNHAWSSFDVEPMASNQRKSGQRGYVACSCCCQRFDQRTRLGRKKPELFHPKQVHQMRHY